MGKKILIYYFLLFALLVGFTRDSSPNIILRVSYLAAVFLPLLALKELRVPVFVAFFITAANSFAYPFLPTEVYYYVIIAIVFALLSGNLFKVHNGSYRVLCAILLLTFLNNLFASFEICDISIIIFITLLLFTCAIAEESATIKYLPFAFILISLALSLWLSIVPDSLISTYNTAAGLEQQSWTDPNYLGCIIGVGCVLAIDGMFNKTISHPIALIVTIFCVIFCVISLVRLASRGALLTLMVSLLFMLLLSKTSLWKKILFIIVAAVLVYILYSNKTFDLLLARIEEGDLTGTGRTEIWKIKSKSFFIESNILQYIFGIGNNAGLQLGQFGRARAFHNDFIAMLVCYGLCGLFLFLRLLSLPLKGVDSIKAKQIVPLVIYLCLWSFFVEPFTSGSLSWYCLYIYTYILSREQPHITDEKA